MRTYNPIPGQYVECLLQWKPKPTQDSRYTQTVTQGVLEWVYVGGFGGWFFVLCNCRWFVSKYITFLLNG